MNQNVEDFINKSNWSAELQKLREILIECGLTEDFKWRAPTYTLKNANVMIIAGFKEYCALSFLKGVLLQDSEGILVSPGENSQSVRFAKFTHLQEIIKLEPVLKAYVYEAIEVEKAGLKVEKKTLEEEVFVEELQEKLKSDAIFKKAFEALTPGRQRAYNIYFSGAKQSKSRLSRIEAYTERILNGKGFNDCVCGYSKRMPNCDGSHKYLK